VPNYTDDLDMIREMSQWIYKNLGPDYPIHFSRFHPAYKLTNLAPTPVSVLEKARDIAVDEGIKYVYLGNVPGSKYESTYCPNDQRVCIERQGYSIKKMNIDSDGNCKQCGEHIAGVWKA